MSGALVSVGSRSYLVTPDIPGRDLAFIIGEVLDDADGRAMAREVDVSSDERLTFAARSQREFALAGNPAVALADRSIAHAVTVTLQARGYRRAVATVTVPPFPVLPHRQDMALRRLPNTVSGRVFGRHAGAPPSYDLLPAATVSLSPIPAAGGELPLLLRQPLRADPGAGASIRRRAATVQAPLAALADAAAGELFVEIADGSALAAGDLLRVGPDHRRFHAEVAEVIAHPDRPAPAALARLTEGLAGAIANGAAIDRLTLGGYSGATGHFVGAAYAGEAVLWLDALPSTASGVLVVREAGLPDRHHDANVPTNAAGDYRIDGFARIGEPTFAVGATGFTTKTGSFPAARIGAGSLDWYLVP
jgi:hypothetical protein